MFEALCTRFGLFQPRDVIKTEHLAALAETMTKEYLFLPLDSREELQISTDMYTKPFVYFTLLETPGLYVGDNLTDILVTSQACFWTGLIHF